MNIKLNRKSDFYASQLTSDFRSYYESAINQLAKGHNHITGRVHVGDDFQAQFKLLYLAIDLDNPEIFCYAKEVEQAVDGNTLILDYKFEYEKDDVNKFDEELNNEVDRIVEIINKIEDDYDKIYRLNRYITVRCRGYMSMEHVASNAYGALISKKSRCEGICKAAKMILDRLGFENFIATGEADNGQNVEPHSWNMIKVKDKWYHFDFMWNVSYAQNGKFPIPIYTFLDDETIKIDHTPMYQFPVCDDKSHLYWVTHNCQIKSTFDLGKVEVVSFKESYFAIAKFPEPLNAYEAEYELSDWGYANFNPGNLSKSFYATYVKPLQIGIFYFEN